MLFLGRATIALFFREVVQAFCFSHGKFLRFFHRFKRILSFFFSNLTRAHRILDRLHFGPVFFFFALSFVQSGARVIDLFLKLFVFSVRHRFIFFRFSCCKLFLLYGFFDLNVFWVVGHFSVVVKVLPNRQFGSWWARLDWLEQVRRLAVDLAVHDLLETTHDNPRVHGALFAQLGPVRLVDGLAELPHVDDPHQDLFKEPTSAVVAVEGLVTDATALWA